MKLKIDQEKLTKAAYIMKTIAHPKRLAIIQLLDHKPGLTVNEICRLLNCEQSLISHHLSNMRLKGLLQANRNGTSMHYLLKEKDIAKLIAVIEKCKCNM